MAMSEDKLKKVIALVGTLMFIFSFAAGYLSGMYGWWWTAILIPVVFLMILNTLGNGGGHH